jgi:O-antigen ligase
MSAAGDWPRTSRALPWLLALFLCVQWLVPTEAIELAIPLPIDAHPDRFLLLGLAVLGIGSLLGARSLLPNAPAASLSLALVVFLAVALLSLAVNAHTLASLGELEQGRKQFVLVSTNLVLFWVVASSIRPSELPKFVVLMVVLATLASLGTIWEYRTDYNVFYDWAKKLFSGFASVDHVPIPSGDSRDETFGPSQHGLAITMMLTFVLPFGVLGILAARTRARKVLYAVAVALIFTAAISTQRKTSVIAPAAALVVLCAYRPAQMLRLAPLGAVMLVAIHLMAPAALGGVASQLTGGFFESGTTIGRTSDYEAIAPDIATHPLLGRGYGTIDPARSDTYRILDNQYLSHLLQIGFLGMAAYVAVILAAMALAHGVIRRGRDPQQQRLALAAMAGFGAFGIANALFDLISFGQVTYLFCFIAGLCSVAAMNREPAPAPAPVPTPVPAT